MASTVLRLGAGVFATPVAKQPAQLLQLYEFEGCPHCRLVRDALTELDLDAMPVDISDELAVQEMVARCERELGPVDVFFSNAGIASKLSNSRISTSSNRPPR